MTSIMTSWLNGNDTNTTGRIHRLVFGEKRSSTEKETASKTKKLALCSLMSTACTCSKRFCDQLRRIFSYRYVCTSRRGETDVLQSPHPSRKEILIKRINN